VLGRLRVRGKLVLLVAVPLLAVLALAIPLVTDALDEADRAAQTAETVELAGDVGELVQNLQQERLLAIGFLLGQVDRTRFLLQAAETNDGVVDIRAEHEAIPAAVNGALDKVKDLRLLRNSVLGKTTNADKIMADYSAMITGLITPLRLGSDVDLATPTGRQVVALDAVLRTGEVISSGSTLLIPMAASKDPRALSAFATKLTELQSTASRLLANTSPEQSQLYVVVQEAFGARLGPTFLTGFATDPVGLISKLSVPVLFPAVESFIGVNRFVERKVVTDVTNEVNQQRRTATLTAYGVIVLSILVLFLAVLLSAAVGRAIARPLTRLTVSADRVARAAETELSRVADDEVEVFEPVRLEMIDVQARDEIGDLARAFERVQTTAAGLVERQVISRRNVAEMFGHVGRRTQNLVSLQLSLIDGLEREETEPGRLQRLYRLDHLSSRLRRNAGSLVVLSGGTGTGDFGAPLPLADVVRLALGEIQDYTRVDVEVPPDLMIAVPVIGDLILVLAELMENATTFSPPDTRVTVAAVRTGPGVRMTVLDYGIGMSPERLAAENARLARRERLDVAPTEVLGLFVVGRLARRHRMGVALSGNPRGGMMATIEIGAHCLAPSGSPIDHGSGTYGSIYASAPQAGPRQRPQSLAQPAVPQPATYPLPTRTPRPAGNGAASDVGVLGRAGRILESAQPWNAFVPRPRVSPEKARPPAVQPAAPPPPPQTQQPTQRPTQRPAQHPAYAQPPAAGYTLRQRVPGAQMPVGSSPESTLQQRPVPQSAPPPAPVDANAARALVEEFEAGVQRAEFQQAGHETPFVPGSGEAAKVNGSSGPRPLSKRVPGASLPAQPRHGHQESYGAGIGAERRTRDPAAARDVVEQFESGVARALREVRPAAQDDEGQ
jgi:signal transduction histidine kinase